MPCHLKKKKKNRQKFIFHNVSFVKSKNLLRQQQTCRASAYWAVYGLLDCLFDCQGERIDLCKMEKYQSLQLTARAL